MKTEVFCSDCGREMVLKPGPAGILSHDLDSGKRTRFIAGHSYPEKEVKGELICPSRLCRLRNYNWLVCHFRYYLIGKEVISEYIGD